MAASKPPSHFTVHVFLSHDPVVARALLPGLFLDFPDAAWKLDPLEKQPPRPREKPAGKQERHWRNPRDLLGRYVLPEAVMADTTLLQLSEMMEGEFNIAKKYQAQFTLFPQFTEEDQYPLWHNCPLPWHMTLADVHPLDRSALDAARRDGVALELTEAYAPVLHLVLETKAAALLRIVHIRFLDAELGMPYSAFRDQWNEYDSFWHSRVWNRQYSQVESNLKSWRVAKFAHTYLTKQRERGRMGPDNDEMKTHLQRVEEVRAIKRQGGFSQ
jgi:hypothetical protein